MALDLLAGELKPNETNKAIQACNDYLRMGAGRSLRKLVQSYNEASTENPPTKHLKTIADWSTTLNWQARAESYDAEIERQKNEAVESRRREALGAGLALDFERILELKDLFSRIKLEIDTNGLYYTDRKMSPKGDVVEVELFNRPMVDTLRGLLDDVAKETGGRKQKLEHSGPEGGPIKTEDATFTDEERAARLLALLDTARKRRDGN